MRAIPLFILFVWLGPAPVQAEGAADFLLMGFGARSFALGDGMLASEQDASAIYWNPALLARAGWRSAEAMHAESFAGAEGYDAFAIAVPVGTGGEAVSLGLLRLAVDHIPDTGNFRFDDNGADGLPGTHDAGEGNGRWDPGEPVTADPSAVRWRSDVEWALLAGYARPLGARGAVGVCAKLVRQSLAGRGASGVGFDVGAHWAGPAGLEFAARARDLTSTRISWDTGARERIGPTLGLAAGREMPAGPQAHLKVSLEGSLGRWDLAGGRSEWHAGLEYAWRELIFLRAGSSSGDAGFGAGLGLRGFRVDYATRPFHPLGASHRLSALARW